MNNKIIESKAVIVGSNSLLEIAKKRHAEGEITDEQFNEIIQRSKETPEEWEEDRVI